MSADFIFLVCCALLTAYGFWASLKNAPKSPWAWIAALLYLAVGVQTVLLITLEGAGEIGRNSVGANARRPRNGASKVWCERLSITDTLRCLVAALP